MCVFRLPFRMNDFWHNSHLYGFSPVWILMCFFRLPLWVNDFWHNWHLYGFSPVEVILRAFRRLLWSSGFWYIWHLPGVSPVSFPMVHVRIPTDVNDGSAVFRWNIVLMCFCKSPFCANYLSHNWDSERAVFIWRQIHEHRNVLLMLIQVKCFTRFACQYK